MRQSRFLCPVRDQERQSGLIRRILFQQPSEGLLKSLSFCNYFLVERGAGRVELAVAERLVCFLGEEAVVELACADPEAGKARFSRPVTAWVRFGSNFHQFIPICSALSTEQINKRMRTVSNSTLASETRISPAITSPLSRMRSRMSTRLALPDTVGKRSIL